jgi:hypothetical protein
VETRVTPNLSAAGGLNAARKITQCNDEEAVKLLMQDYERRIRMIERERKE